MEALHRHEVFHRDLKPDNLRQYQNELKRTPYLQQLSNVFHKEPYPTATLGLFHLRKGNIERAQQFYEEAIHLAKNAEDKTRIRQKLNLELGLEYLHSEPSRARRFLQRVTEHYDTVPQLARHARTVLNRLERPS